MVLEATRVSNDLTVDWFQSEIGGRYLLTKGAFFALEPSPVPLANAHGPLSRSRCAGEEGELDRDPRQFQTLLFGAVDRDFVACIGMAHYSGGGVVPGDILQAPGGIIYAVGHDVYGEVTVEFGDSAGGSGPGNI